MKIIISIIFLMTSLVSSASDIRGKSEMFRVLGFVSEYMSRFDHWTGEPYKDLVAQFYPSQRAMADEFEVCLKAYFAAHERPYSVTRATGEQGHTRFLDKWMSAQINQHYTRISDTNSYTVDREYILSGDKECLLAYLSSVYRRYGKEGAASVYLANASEQAETIAHAFLLIGSAKATIWNTVEFVPTSYRVDFEPTADFSRIFTGLRPVNPPPEHENWKQLTIQRTEADPTGSGRNGAKFGTRK